MALNKKPFVLIVLDGWGYSENQEHNAIALAHKPHFDHLWKTCPHTLIEASGQSVGLPEGIMGNSEVGHMNLGAGRVVYSGLSQIYRAIEDQTFFKNPALLKAMHQAKNENSTLHLLGLVSEGAVHSHQDHLFALLKMAADFGLKKVCVHAILDGRDTDPKEGLLALQKLENKMSELSVGELASVGGRYFAMDRDKNYDRIQKAFEAITGQSLIVDSAQNYVEENYAQGITDEFIPWRSLPLKSNQYGIAKNDAVVFFNFRADRARQMSHALTQENFSFFKRSKFEVPDVFVSMMPYEKALKETAAFESEPIHNTLPAFLSEQNLTQLRLAETEKYAHVTFFFNGGVEAPFAGEDRILIASSKEVPTYDLKPEMSAYLVKTALVKAILEQKHDFILCNFANTDMVGHTAKPEAVKKSVEVVDECLGEILKAIEDVGATALITADHGNAECLQDKAGRALTAHTTNPVPCLLVGQKAQKAEPTLSMGRLSDVAPTVLWAMGLKAPSAMTGQALFRTKK